MGSDTFHYSLRVPYRATDASGILHFTELPHYFELAEHAFFREIGCPQSALDPLDFPRVSLQCDYLAPVKYDDCLDVYLRIDKIGNSSLRYEFQVLKADNPVGEGTMTVVCVDETGQSRRLPEAVRRGIESFQQDG